MSQSNLHFTLKNIRHGWSIRRLWREFDLTYWQMQSALGYPVPSRIEARWPRAMNADNPYKCGFCEARKEYPGLHVQCDIVHARNFLTGHKREDFERRLGIALTGVGQ